MTSPPCQSACLRRTAGQPFQLFVAIAVLFKANSFGLTWCSAFLRQCLYVFLNNEICFRCIAAFEPVGSAGSSFIEKWKAARQQDNKCCLELLGLRFHRCM